MNRNLLFTILIVSLFSTGLFAQITLTSDYLPTAGDKIEISVAENFTDLVLPSGGNHDVDFSGLTETDSYTQTYLAASESELQDSFPTANLVLVDSQTGGSLFYFSDANTYDYIGFIGEQYLGIDVPVKMTPSAPVTRRKAPFNFGDLFDGDFDVSLSFDANQLPDTLFASSPIKPDSIKISIVSHTTNIAEGFGIVKIPGGEYDALRIKSIETRNTKVEGKLGTIWIDITSFLPFDGLGDVTIESYAYYSNETVTPILTVTLDTDKNISGVSYKKNELGTFNTSVDFVKPNLNITPNPVIDSSVLNFSNVTKGDYEVKIFNVLGREVWSNQYKIAGSKKITVDFSSLRRGTYLYSLIDSSGKTISTKRLLVLRP